MKKTASPSAIPGRVPFAQASGQIRSSELSPMKKNNLSTVALVVAALCLLTGLFYRPSERLSSLPSEIIF